jgi:hypothetical protein
MIARNPQVQATNSLVLFKLKALLLKIYVLLDTLLANYNCAFAECTAKKHV